MQRAGRSNWKQHMLVWELENAPELLEQESVSRMCRIDGILTPLAQYLANSKKEEILT
jgi:hypothetical protein